MKKQLFTFLAGFALLSGAQAQTVWQVSTFAGNGTRGSTNGTGAAVSFDAPAGICNDATGNIYVADYYGQKIRKITTAGVVSTFAGSGQAGSDDGTGAAASFNSPAGVCTDASGNIYVAEQVSGNIRKITSTSVVSTLANIKYGLAGICIGSGGNLYVANYSEGIVYKITPAGTVSIFASGFPKPSGICTDAAGNIYVTQRGSFTISKITPAGVVSTFASGVGEAIAICLDGMGNFYTCGFDNLIHKITATGVVSVIAGSSSGSIDDIGTKASFSYPYGISVDATGNLYVGDYSNNKIRKLQQITPTPPVPNYNNLPASMCLGSNANYQPATTGSQAGFTLQLDSSLTMPAPKAICRNKNGVFVVSAADSVMFYDFNGNLQFTYNTMPTFQNVTGIAADDANRIYLVAPDQLNASMKSVYRLDAQGNWDTQFSLANYQLNSASAIAFGPGNLYVVDTLGPYIDLIDTTSSGSPKTVTALPQPNNNQYSFYKPTSMVFGSNGQIYLADAGHKAILARNAADNNYYAVDSLLGNHQYFSIDMDTTINNNTGNNTFFVTSDVSPSLAWVDCSSFPSTSGAIVSHHTDTVPLMHLRNPMGNVYVNKGGTVPVSWIANSGGNNVMRLTVLAYSITPPLPTGLNYNFITGKITGSPTVTSPYTTYTIVTTSTAGSNTKTIAFSVVPPGPISNTVGTTSSNVVDHADGLTVNYFNSSDCSQMISIQDAPGGTVMGNTIATQTVYPTIATFNADQFVGRVTEVATQSPDSALANVQLNFTYQDIQHYNASVASTYTLSNDTTGAKQMKVGILQTHTTKIGSIHPISHSPLTANWVTAHHRWEVKFAVTKFSTFYMADTAKVSGFQCANSHLDSIVTTGAYYLWHNDTIYSSGVYADTLVNKTGCDSICNLKLTLTNTTGVSELANSEGVYIFPNPSNGKFNLNIKNNAVVTQNIRVINIIGAEVYNSNISGSTVIDLSNEDSGVYYVIITSQNNTIIRRVVKQ